MEEHAMTVSSLKPLLYEMLITATGKGNNGSQLDLNQSLGVNLSNAVRKDGVNIIQIQNANLESIVPGIVDILQIVDKLEMKYSPLLDADRQLNNLNHRLTQIELKRPPEVIDVVAKEVKEEEEVKEEVKVEDEEDIDPIEELVDFAYEQQFDWNTISDLMKVRYVEFLKRKLGTTSKAVEFLKISVTSYYSAKKRVSGDEKKGGNGTDSSYLDGDGLPS
jgi:hypothetical protein